MEDLDEIGTEKVPEDARMTALWSARNRELRATRIVVFFIYVVAAAAIAVGAAWLITR